VEAEVADREQTTPDQQAAKEDRDDSDQRLSHDHMQGVAPQAPAQPLKEHAFGDAAVRWIHTAVLSPWLGECRSAGVSWPPPPLRAYALLRRSAGRRRQVYEVSRTGDAGTEQPLGSL